MGTEYLLTSVDRSFGFEREFKLFQFSDIESIKSKIKFLSSEHELRVYKRSVSNWQRMESEEINGSE